MILSHLVPLLSLELIFVEKFDIHLEMIMILRVLLENIFDVLYLVMSFIHSLLYQTIN